MAEEASTARNTISGTVQGPVVQAGTITGDVHLHAGQQPSLRVQLLAGIRRGSEFTVLPLDSGASSIQLANPAQIDTHDVDRALVLQVINGSMPIWVQQLAIEFRNEHLPNTPYLLPSHIPGASDIPHHLAARSSVSWPVDLNGLDAYVALVTGKIPCPDLPIRARVVTGEQQTVHGCWHHYDAITAAPTTRDA